MKKFLIKKLEDWTAVAEAVAESLEPRAILTLSGPLGAGKTTFVQALAKELGSTSAPKSPTFSLLRTYGLKKGADVRRLIHVDAYRIEKPEDVLPLNLDEELAEPGTVLAIEWPENLQAWLERQTTKKITLAINLQKNGTREVALTSS